MITLIFNSFAVILFLFIVWWFWLTKAKVALATEIIDIKVAHGAYVPTVIKTTKGQLLKLRFFRQDASPCAEWVIFPNLNISEQLPLNKPHLITLKIEQSGNYDFTCQMNMYRGKIIVE